MSPKLGSDGTVHGDTQDTGDSQCSRGDFLWKDSCNGKDSVLLKTLGPAVSTGTLFFMITSHLSIVAREAGLTPGQLEQRASLRELLNRKLLPWGHGRASWKQKGKCQC